MAVVDIEHGTKAARHEGYSLACSGCDIHITSALQSLKGSSRLVL